MSGTQQNADDAANNPIEAEVDSASESELAHADEVVEGIEADDAHAADADETD